MDLASPSRPRLLLSILPLLMCLLLAAASFAQEGGGGPASAPTSAPTSTVTAPPPSPEEYYGAYVLIPPLVTIVLAIALRQVIPALSIGVLVAAFMFLPCAPASEAYGGGVIGGLRLAVEGYLIGALADRDHIMIIVFTMMIGGTVGIIAANGGTKAAVDRVARWASTRERGQVATWFAGLVVFFDDYANAMIVGPAMRPVCDRLRISRAKLAYIVDSTAAPVSSIALIGTWVGTEIGYIDDGLRHLAERPEFLTDITAYQAFLASIPYRFYAILALVMVLLVGWLGRDFGPMLRAENEARRSKRQAVVASDREVPTGRAWYAIVPISILVAVTLALLGVTGVVRTIARVPGHRGLVGDHPRCDQRRGFVHRVAVWCSGRAARRGRDIAGHPRDEPGADGRFCVGDRPANVADVRGARAGLVVVVGDEIAAIGLCGDRVAEQSWF